MIESASAHRSPARGRRADSSSGITNRLAAWAVGTTWEKCQPNVIETAKLHILDTVGVAIAGGATDQARIVTDVVGGGASVAGTWGGVVATRVDGASAALINGVAAHALDFDDQGYSVSGHPSAVVLPAVVGLAQELGRSGRELIVAYLVGVEVASKIGRWLNPVHFQRGWHSTATIGSLGSAAGCAKLADLSAEQTTYALGLAAVSAGGLRANNLTMAKAYQAGQAAKAGVVSVKLASSGLDASPDILGAANGFATTYNGDSITNEELVEGLAAPWEIEEPGLMIKQYPACSGIATALDALIALLSEEALTAADVSEIVCDMTPLGYHSMPVGMPRFPYEGKFSVPFCLAAATLYGEVTLDTFSSAMLEDESVRELSQRVRVTHKSTSEWAPKGGEEGSTVTVRTRSGRTIARHRPFAKGSGQDRFTTQEVVGKACLCMERRLPAGSVEAMIEAILSLEQQESLTFFSGL